VALDVFVPAACLAGVYTATSVRGYVLEGRQKRQVSRAFGQYMSPVVIRELLKNPERLRLGGERREIAVLFSDIKGFSTFSEAMEEEALVSFLNTYLTAMTDIVLARRGILDKYIGDAIMAFWGAPLPLACPAAEACLAVLDQRAALERLNERFRAEGRQEIEFRAGITLGPAVVGNMGSTQRFAYTAMGDTVNLASRLEGANKFFGTSVMLSEAAKEAASDAVVTRRLGRVRVVGKSVPCAVYELVGRRGEVSKEDLERLDRYHEALGLLERGAVRDAARRFEEVLHGKPDPVARVCLEKCKEIESTKSGWDGIWVLASK
jgi:adenylate cyclase